MAQSRPAPGEFRRGCPWHETPKVPHGHELMLTFETTATPLSATIVYNFPAPPPPSLCHPRAGHSTPGRCSQGQFPTHRAGSLGRPAVAAPSAAATRSRSARVPQASTRAGRTPRGACLLGLFAESCSFGRPNARSSSELTATGTMVDWPPRSMGQDGLFDRVMRSRRYGGSDCKQTAR